MAKKRVLGVVGMGHVGAHVAYALAIQGIADELVLVDQNEQKLASEVQDLRDAVAYMPHRVTVRGGDFSDLGVCDVIVNSVGKIDLLRGTHDRVTEMDFTIPAVRGYAEKIKASGFDGVLINITNPCDIVTRELALHLGLPRGRVFGTGTGLDTSRLLSALARQTGLDHKSITCYMMGEHGNQQFAPWSCVSFRGVPLVVQLMILYFGLPNLGIYLEPYPASVLGFILCTGAYQSEYVRGALLSIRQGQIKAAYALGFTKLQTILWVVIPQAARRALPGCGNEIIYLIKYSSLAYIITCIELTGEAKVLVSRSFRPTEVYIVAGIYYLVLVSFATWFLQKLERKFAIPGFGKK